MITDDDLGDVQRPRRSISHDRCVGLHERGELIELPARVQLLPDPDPGVREDDGQEERVSPVGEDERQ